MFFILSDIISINSLLAALTFPPESKMFLKLLNSFLTLNISVTNFFDWSWFKPISLINLLNSDNFFGSKPSKVIFPALITSSLDVNSSSILPINLLKAGFRLDIPDSLAIVYKDLSISLIRSLAVTWPPDILPSTLLIPSKTFCGFPPLGTKGLTIYLSITLSNLSLLSFKFLPASDLLLATVLIP